MVSKACVASAAESVMPLEIVVRKGFKASIKHSLLNSGLRLMRAARFWIYTRYFQKIGKNLMTSLRRDAFGMKLHAVNRPLRVAQAHNHGVGCLGGNFKAVRHGFGRYRQRMIAGYGQRCGQVFKNMGAVMAYIAQLAMHDIGCPNNFASKGLPDALVA